MVKQLLQFILILGASPGLHAWRIQTQHNLLSSPPVTVPEHLVSFKLSNSTSNFLELLLAVKSDSNVVDALDNVAFVFSAAAIAYFVVMIILRNPKLDEELAKRDEERGKLVGNYNATINDMEASLKHMTDMQIEWTEHSFNDQKKDFVRFLNHVKDHKEFFGQSSPALLLHFRGFVATWLGVYRECSKNPVDTPNLVASEEDLGGCSSVVEVAELIGHRLALEEVQFLGKSGSGWHNPFKAKSSQSRLGGRRPAALEENQPDPSGNRCSWCQCLGMNRNFFKIDEPDEDGWPFTLSIGSCVGVTFFSPTHISVVLSFMLGLVLLGVEAACMRVASVLLLTGELALLVVLIRFEKIDDLSRLELECGALQTDNESVEEHRKEISDFYERVGDFADIWAYRTNPCLALLKGIHIKLEDSCQGDPDQSVQLLKCATEGMSLLISSQGPLQFWMGLDCNEGLKISRKGIEDCSDFVENNDVQAIVQHHNTMFGVIRLVRVRVESADHLPRGSLFNKIDPFVRVRIGDADWARTRTIENKQSPKWGGEDDEDFTFEPRTLDAKLEVEVMHDAVVSEDAAVSKVALSVANLAPGKWHNVREPLPDTDKGEVEVSIFVCRAIEHLAVLMPPVQKK